MPRSVYFLKRCPLRGTILLFFSFSTIQGEEWDVILAIFHGIGSSRTQQQRATTSHSLPDPLIRHNYHNLPPISSQTPPDWPPGNAPQTLVCLLHLLFPTQKQNNRRRNSVKKQNNRPISPTPPKHIPCCTTAPLRCPSLGHTRTSPLSNVIADQSIHSPVQLNQFDRLRYPNYLVRETQVKSCPHYIFAS